MPVHRSLSAAPVLSVAPVSFFYSSGDHRDLHSFPTRRSSDLEGFDLRRRRRQADQIEVGAADQGPAVRGRAGAQPLDRKSTRLNSSHVEISYAVFCLKKKTKADCTYPPYT